MTDFHPKKLKVRFILPASPTEPLNGRKYTITHSDDSGQLFLDIGTDFNYEAMSANSRVEIMTEWQIDWQYRLTGRVYVDLGDCTIDEAQIRFNDFQKSIAKALQGIAFGDRLFLSNYPLLLDAPIYIYFESNYQEFKQLYYYGTLKQYLMPFQYEI